MARNLPHLTQNIDSEFLHKYRVALRCTRSLLRDLSKIAGDEKVRLALTTFKREFSWLGESTNALRDLEVLHLRLVTGEGIIKSAATDRTPLEEALVYDIAIERKRLALTLQCERYQNFTQNWLEFIAQNGALGNIQQSSTRFIDYLRGRLEKLHRRLLRAAELVTSESTAQGIHELRIRGKRYRYSLDLYLCMSPSETGALRIRDLKKFQDLLGANQDSVVQTELLESYYQHLLHVGEQRRDCLVALREMITAESRHQQRLTDKIPPAMLSFIERMKNAAIP